jgi:Sap-like sulfolipid-1-addressing protein
VGDAIGELIPYAAGVAASPLPIIAVILALFSTRARIAGPAFLLGSLAGVTVVSIAVYVLARSGRGPGEREASTASHWVRLALGVLLLVIAFVHWRKHVRKGSGAHSMPRWMAGADRWSPTKAAVLALLMYGVDPKNLALCAAAGRNIARADLSVVPAMVAIVVFAVVACLPIAVLVGAYLAGGDRAAGLLDRCRIWLSAHHLLVMAGLLLVFGVILISHGARGLLY